MCSIIDNRVIHPPLSALIDNVHSENDSTALNCASHCVLESNQILSLQKKESDFVIGILWLYSVSLRLLDS